MFYVMGAIIIADIKVCKIKFLGLNIITHYQIATKKYHYSI